YTYAWSPTGGTSLNATGLSGGTYTITVTDNNHCTAAATVIITQPASVLSAVPASVNVLCNGDNNGDASVAVSGGATPYTYSWSNGQTSSNASNLTAGT